MMESVEVVAEWLRRFIFWLRWRLGMSLSFRCERSGTCKCQGKDAYLHTGAHFRCLHCTNPFIGCRRCNVRYLDIVAPMPGVWIYEGFRKGWRHNRCTG